MRSQFIVQEEDGVLVVTDLGGDRSVTNDAEAVVKHLASRYDLGQKRIVYRDSEGRWDGLAVQNGEFAGFVMIGGRCTEDAVRCAQARTIWSPGINV